jgi:hypothetical protein
VLQPDPTAVIEEGLEVLIVVVDLVLDREDRLHEVGILGAFLALELRDVPEIPEPVGDRAFGERRAFERCDDADHVHDGAVRVGLGLDPHHIELRGIEP